MILAGLLVLLALEVGFLVDVAHRARPTHSATCTARTHVHLLEDAA